MVSSIVPQMILVRNLRTFLDLNPSEVWFGFLNLHSGDFFDQTPKEFYIFVQTEFGWCHVCV